MRIRAASCLITAIALGSATRLWASEAITHGYVSPRVSAMGGVMYTTGLWDDNFYGNPARAAGNPWFKFRMVDVLPMIETTIPTIMAIPAILGSSDPVAAVGTQAGNQLHFRIQTAFPSVFIPARGERKWAFAFGLTTQTTIDGMLRRSYQTDFSAQVDAAFHFTVARKLLPDDMLALGLTARVAHRLSGNPAYSLVDYFQGRPLSLLATAGDGMMVDGDAGFTFTLPWKPKQFEFSVGGAITNILGGGYANIPLSITRTGVLPVAQPRSLGGGFAVRRALWGPFKDSTLALEVSDILNSGYGSFWRLINMGAESRWRFFVARVGLHQGYLTAGLGLYFRFFTMDVTTYGEEMGLTAGALESRRFALRMGLQIVN